MVKLTDDYQAKAADFKAAGIAVPQFDQEQMKQTTEANPVWVHFGGGNLFRCFHAKIAQDLLNNGSLKSGVVVAETYDGDVPADIYKPYNDRVLQVVMQPDGTLDKTLIASVAEAISTTRPILKAGNI